MTRVSGGDLWVLAGRLADADMARRAPALDLFAAHELRKELVEANHYGLLFGWIREVPA